MLQGLGVLSLTIWVPIVFGIAVLVFGREGHPAPVRWTVRIASVGQGGEAETDQEPDEATQEEESA